MRTITISISDDGTDHPGGKIVISGPRRSGKSVFAQLIGRALQANGAKVEIEETDVPYDVRSRVLSLLTRMALDFKGERYEIKTV